MIETSQSNRGRTALQREIFEASHLLDRHPIPIDPDDDDATAAARIAIDRLGVHVVAPLRVERSPHEAVIAIADASQTIARRVMLGRDWHSADHGPMVGFTKDDGAPVALIPREGRGGYSAVDPRNPSRVERVDAAVAARFEGVAFIFAPTLPDGGLGLGGLFVFGIRESLRDIGRVAILGLISVLLAAVVPLAIGPLLESILPAGLRTMLVTTVALLVLSISVGAMAEIVRNFSVVRAKTRFAAKLQRSIVHRLIAHSPAFFRSFTVADLSARALGIDDIDLYVSDAALTAVLTGIFSLVSFLIVLAQDAAVGIVCAILGAMTIAAFALEASLVLPLRREIRTRASRLAAYVHQAMTGIAKIRAAAAVDRIFVRWMHGFLVARRFNANLSTIAYRFAIFGAVWPAVATLCIIATILAVHDGAMEPGTFFTIVSAFGQLLAGLLLLGSNIATAVAIVPIYERLKPILDEVPERISGASDPGRLSGAITIRDVSFTYAGASRPALSDIDVTIAAGSFVAIVGPSGSGKSTLLRLLLGFERPSSGTIAFDGHDLASLDVVAVRRQIGTVLQTATLLPGSIFENISGSAVITREQAWEAARQVGIADDIEAMPMKLETVVGANGGGLSGGQRQRIVIARAIVQHPRLLFLDEATSALDNATQGIVNQNLARLDATRIVIAHRLSTIVDADRILVMQGGRIVEDGRYEELLAASGLFARLASHQQLSA